MLDLDDNNLEVLPEWVGRLTEMRALSLVATQLNTMPESLGQLTQLQELYLSENNLTELPEWMCSLTELQTLHLSSNQLTVLPESLGRLTHLQTLFLSDNQLRALPESLGQLKQLQTLNLDNNQLTELPEWFVQLTQLQEFIVSSNQLTELPEWLVRLTALKELCLHGNPGLGLPPEVLGPCWSKVVLEKATPENPKAILDYYFRINDPDEALPLNEFKLIVVGRGEVGKTTLVEKLVTDKFQKFDKTPGGKITQWPITIDGNSVRAHVWDFGGQEIMHGTHRFFMTERAVYLVLVSKRTGTEDHDADYWLSLIRSFAGKDAPVILLLHRWNEQHFELNREQLTQKYGPHLCFLETDCGEDPAPEVNIRPLRDWIAREAAKLPGLKSKWPKVWRSVKEDLPKEQKNWLAFADFESFCIAHNVPRTTMSRWQGGCTTWADVGLSS